jgi:sugar lactone lactonase YvrE
MRIANWFGTAAALALGLVLVSLGNVSARSASAETIFVDNMYYVTAYPTGSFGDVASVVVTTDMTFPGAIARDSSERIYVVNTATNTIAIYPANASGNVPPIAAIGGALTQLASPMGIALDTAGNIYVADSGTSTITIYPPLGASSGALNEAPTAAISGNTTLLYAPVAIALDGSGNIYVANEGGGPSKLGPGYAPGVITIYPAGSNGNIAPMAAIAGSATGLVNPVGLALDSSGKIYLGNQGATIYENQEYTYPASITVFSPGSAGNAAPGATISGSNTGLQTLNGIALDSTRSIYATNGSAIEAYAAGSSGDISPMTTISGNNTGLSGDNGIVLDGSGNLYVSNRSGGSAGKGSVTEYSAGSRGDIAPSDSFTSSYNGINLDTGIAVDQTGKIYLASLGSNSIGIYSAGSYATGAPAATIAGSNTGLDYPLGLATDANGNLAALNFTNPITLYSAGSSADVKPTRTLNVDRRGENVREAIAMGTKGALYVASQPKCNGGCFGSNFGSIGIYGADSKGDAAPKAIINGPDTQLAFPIGIAVSNRRKIFVLNQTPVCEAHCGCFPGANGYVTVYAPDSFGNTKPIAAISGFNSGMGFPRAIAVDANENIYVLATHSNVLEGFACSYDQRTAGWTANITRRMDAAPTGADDVFVLPPVFDFGPGAPDVLVFAAGSKGNTAPEQVIGGPLTGLDGFAIAVGPTEP